MIEQEDPHVVVDIHIDRADVIHKIGNSVLYKETIQSGIPSQHNQGGQSQQRFLRAHQEAVKSFLKRIKKETKGMSVTYVGNEFMVKLLEPKAL